MLGSPRPYLKSRRRMMFQLSGFYSKSSGFAGSGLGFVSGLSLGVRV